MDADFLVMLIVTLCLTVNRQSLIFLCAFAVSEVFYYTDTDPIFDSLVIALTFAYLALIARKFTYELQMALIAYSFLFWFASVDYLLFTQETYFYVIFPYVIKAVDIYVIFHLIHKGVQGIGANHSAPSGNWI